LTKADIQKPRHEHSVPWFWPMAAAIEMEEAGIRAFADNMRFFAEAEKIESPPPPKWATKNRVLRNLDTMLLRDFSRPGVTGTPVLVDAPYAGHSSTIADFAKGQSLAETLMTSGLSRVLVTDWKSASRKMRDYDIDRYLSDLDRAVEAIGGRVHLVGLCQGGWMAAMYACLHRDKVASLVLAGSPIDTNAGDGPIKRLAHATPMRVYEEMVAAGGGRMLGQFMLAGWKDMHPGEQYLGKFIDLYAHIEDRNYIDRTERFERWYENPIDMPGAFYLQAIRELFKENRFARGEFVALGRTLSLKTVICPVFLLAGREDDITTPEQVFAAEHLVGTPPERIRKSLVPGGHIGLFMGKKTLETAWPKIARWIAAIDHGEEDRP
jgi:poly(3-hydroxybutyrate) depolymerase